MRGNARLRDPRRPRAFALLAALLGASLLAGCASGGSQLLIAASSPREGGGLTIFAAVPSGLARIVEGTASYEIWFGEERLYPPGGLGGNFPMENGRGSVFVPYNLFVVGNGNYEVVVHYRGETARVKTLVEKWVNYVYLHPYDRGSKIVIDSQLSRSTGGLPTDRITTQGRLLLELHYRGMDGRQDRYLNPTLTASTGADESFSRVEVPRSRFSEGPGYYSVEPVFHNDQAKGNLWVKGDPTMGQRNPPWNWIYIAR